jgi:hypothetical protein
MQPRSTLTPIAKRKFSIFGKKSREPLGSARLTFVACIAALPACLALTPHPEDAQAPRDFYRQVRPPASTCKRMVEVLSPETPIRRPYKELSALSATCSPGARSVCERRLKDRACERGADAVLLNADAGPTPAGASSLSEISVSGRAVAWADE